MLQVKKKSSKSVIILLMFFTATTHGLIPILQPSGFRSTDRNYRISIDSRRIKNLPEIRTLARENNQKDRVYENVYDRRSFRTGPDNIRSHNADEKRLVDRRLDERNTFRNAVDARNRNFRADLSKSDSVRQFRNARVNFENIRSAGQDLRVVRFTRNSRTDSTNHFRDRRNDIISSDYRRNILSEDSREFRDTLRQGSILEQRISQNNRRETSPVREHTRESRVRNILGDEMRQRILDRKHMQGSVHDRQINQRSRQVEKRDSREDTKTCYESGRCIVPQRRIPIPKTSSRTGEYAQRIRSDILQERRMDSLSSMEMKKTFSDNSLINVAQTVLVIYMIWQVVAKSFPKRCFRFPNMFSVKEKLH